MWGASDAEILARATAELRVAVTLDRDFSRLLATNAALRPSVIFIRRQGLRAHPIVSLLRAVVKEYAEPLDAGCVVTIGVRGTRVRRLPLR